MAQRELRHYMQKLDRPNQQFYPVDIEAKFKGLKYMKAEGLNTIGKAKNVYTESYAESNSLRVFLPDESSVGYANEATVINMTFVVLGDVDTRNAIIDAFSEYVRKGRHSYWDTMRERLFTFIVTDEIKVSDEKWYGTQPYVEITIPMQNLEGNTTYIHKTDGTIPIVGNPKVVETQYNEPLQNAIYGANLSASSDYTTIYEAMEIDSIAFALGSGNTLEHLAELNYFINLNMPVLDLSNCSLLGSVTEAIPIEDGSKDYVDFLPRRTQDLEQDFEEIDMSGTQLKGVNLRSGTTLESISYSDYTEEVVLVGQEALTTVEIPEDCASTLEKLVIEDCNELEEISWV